MLSKKSKDIISKNEKLVNANIEKWVREAKADAKTKIDWDGLVEHFNTVTNKEGKNKVRVVNAKAKRQFRGRMADGYTKTDIATAIFNCYHSEHHRSTNHRYLTLEFISRADKFEMYLTAKPEIITQAQKRNDSL
jgi:hypothetical protein